MLLQIILENSSLTMKPIRSVIFILFSYLRSPSNKEKKEIVAKIEAKAESRVIVIIY